MATSKRTARVTVTHAFASCPVGYKPGDAVTIDLDAPGEHLLCPGVKEALDPFLDVAKEHRTAESQEFTASCHCPHSKSEVVFHLHVFPALPHRTVEA